MTTSISPLLIDLTEEEAASIQGGLFINLPFFGGDVNGGGNTNPLNFGFTSLFLGWEGLYGLSQSTPGANAPVDPVGLDPSALNAALFQILFKL